MTGNFKISNILICLILNFLGYSVQGQAFIEDITNIFEFDVGPERADTNFRHAKVVLAPIVSYEPSTSLAFGIGGKLLFKPSGAGPETRTSNIPLSIQYTLRNQFIAYSEWTIFSSKENYLSRGNIAFSKFPLAYYGIGNTSKDDDLIDISFDNFILEPLFFKKVASNLFIGGGWRLNFFKNLQLLEEHEEILETFNIQDSLGSISSGFELAITLDSRNNVLNAGFGTFTEFTHGIYTKVLGSSTTFMLTKLDFRKYWTISKQRPDDVLAIELYSRLSWNDVPLLELSSLGGAELLRGFQEGRFRDRFSFFSQVEYRWQALERIGFTFFGGIGEVTDKISNIDFGNIKYSIGSGLRLKIVKSENLNIRIDYAFGLGPTKDHNLYVGIAEAF